MRVAILFLSAVAIAFAAPASAQLAPEIGTGSILHAKPHGFDPGEAAVIRKQLAQCVYQVSKLKALALLVHSDIQTVDARSAGIRDFVRDLKLDTCLGDQAVYQEITLGMQLLPTVLRDALAEEAYLAKNHVAPFVPPDASPISFAPVSAGSDLAVAQGLTTFTDCTVRRNVSGADALLRTVPGSESERQAAAALAPDMGACLLAGQNLSLKPANIRALLAFAMWSRFGR